MSTVFSIVISGASGTLCWAVDQRSAGAMAGPGKRKEKPFFGPLNQMATTDFNRKSLLPSGETLGTSPQKLLCAQRMKELLHLIFFLHLFREESPGNPCSSLGEKLRQELPRWVPGLLFAHARIPKLAKFCCLVNLPDAPAKCLLQSHIGAF